MKFGLIEIRDLIISWLVLGFCFSFHYLIPAKGMSYSQSIVEFVLFLGISLVGIGAGFLFHELAHKGVAQRFGYRAEFRMWKLGLLIAVGSAILSFGNFLFFAPGAVYTSAPAQRDAHKDGLISAAGPIANLVMALFFFSLSTSEGLTGVISSFGFQVNLWLAAFNLIPFPPLDGVKILSWNKAIWALMAILSWGPLLIIMFGVFK